ncbi:hypothetical protein BANRA_00541 [Acinetobacter baumannii]|nr:hypothetical protein BANRA_00541 [Acinetobacter baumannii]
MSKRHILKEVNAKSMWDGNCRANFENTLEKI